MKKQTPNPVSTEDKLTQFVSNPNSYYTLQIVDITNPRNQDSSDNVKFKFTNQNQNEVQVVMSLDDFFVFDNFTLVYLIRYALHKNDPRFYKQLLEMIGVYEMKITDFKK